MDSHLLNVPIRGEGIPSRSKRSCHTRTCEKAHGLPGHFYQRCERAIETVQSSNGEFHEIIAAPKGTAYSFDSPIASLEDANNLEFEIIPDYFAIDEVDIVIRHSTTGNSMQLLINHHRTSVDHVFRLYCITRRIRTDEHKLLLDGERIDYRDKQGKGNRSIAQTTINLL